MRCPQFKRLFISHKWYILNLFISCLILAVSYLIFSIADIVQEKNRIKEATTAVPCSFNHSRYIDREKAIKNLDKQLSTLNSDSIVKILITGIPGSGKTVLTEEYAYQYSLKLKNYPNKIVKIFYAENIEDLNREFRDFATTIGIYAPDYTDEDLLYKLKKKFEQINNWLLVFDNINNLEVFANIEKFISSLDKSHNAKIIITSNNEGIAKIALKRNYKLINNNIADNFRFNKEEISALFDKYLGPKHPDYGKKINNKIVLAEKVCFLPQAIKIIAAYLKNSPQNMTIEEYDKMLSKELKYTSFFSKCDKHYLKIYSIVNKISLLAFKDDKPALDLLAFIAFLNPAEINEELLKLWLKKNGGGEAVIEKLLDYAIIAPKEKNIYRIHRSIHSQIFDIIPDIYNVKFLYAYNSNLKLHKKNLIFDKEKLNHILAFVRDNFKRDNTTIEKRIKNSLFIPHIATINSYQVKLSGKDYILADYLYLNVVATSYYMMSGQSIKARDILTKDILALDHHISKILTSFLVNKTITHNELAVLIIYSQSLYHLGRIFFDLGEIDSPPCKLALEKAIYLRDIIDEIANRNQSYAAVDAVYNEYKLDSILVRRNGLFEYIRRTSNSIPELEMLIDKYKKLELLNTSNFKHVWSCKSEVFRIRQKIAFLTQDFKQKRGLCNEALKEIYQFLSDNELKDNKLLFAKIINFLEQRKNDTRLAKYINDVGNLFLITSNHQLAKDFFLEAIKFEEEQNINGIELADAYLGLAKSISNYPILALDALERCREIQIKNNLNSNNEKAKEVIRLIEEVKAKL